jgi:hypothetical protein
MNHFVNFGLLFSFMTLAVSGVLSFVLPFSIIVARTHIVFGLVTLILVGFHLFTKLRYFKKQFKVNHKRVAICAFVWIVLLASAWENWWPAKTLVDQSYEARHRHEIVRPHPLIGSIQEGNKHTSSRSVAATGKTALSVHVALTEKDKDFPAIVIWAESKNGTIIETLFLNEELAFSDRPVWDGKVTPRHHIFPIWRHRYTSIVGVSPDGEVDAASGATSDHQFSLDSHLSSEGGPFTIFIEINASGDTDDSSQDSHIGQPSILYSAYIEPQENKKYYLMDLTGQGADATKDGAINYAIETIGSAKDILDLVLIELKVE